MRRRHLIELEDLPWFPASIRNGITDFLEFAVVSSNLYRPVVARLDRALLDSQSARILDLCSGGGGPWKRLRRDLHAVREARIRVLLSDIYPNREAFSKLAEESGGRVCSVPEPISAMDAPSDLADFRTLFSSFHHFTPEQAQRILADAVTKRQGIGIFESTQRHPLLLLYMLFTPLLVLLSTPFIRPLRWQRLFWTYLVPAIPLAVMFDGIVSCLRTYSVDELTAMTQALGEGGYRWEIGIERLGPLPVGVTYLIGYPVEMP